MDDFQRTSLAEFSRTYLRSRAAARDKPDESLEPTASSQLSENNFAVQVVLGMTKNADKVSRLTAP
jgi:hypothetical protein